MIRRLWTAVVLSVVMGCSGGPSEAVLQDSPPDVFVGAWRSVTPSLEFIGLSVSSKSSDAGTLGARLTFSGVAWEGGGRIEGDSLVADMMVAGTTHATATIVARVRGGLLHVELQSPSSELKQLTFRRED